METNASVLLQSVVLPSVIGEPPAKPARVSSSHSKQQERQRTLSVGYSLNSNANFYDIPVSDAFNDLLERYVPPQERPQRDVSSDKAKGPEAMVMNNMWRSIAKYSRQRIVQSDPAQVENILKLWHMRLLALTKLGLSQLASAEFEKLGDLDRPELRDMHTDQSLVPFELRILWGALPSFLKYPNIALERITMLAVYCKKMQKRENNQVWKQREVQTYLVLATHLISIKDYSAAASTMELILTKVPDNIDILSSLGRLYLQMGDMTLANRMFQTMEEKYGKDEVAEVAVNTNKAFVFMAQGEWTQARDILQKVYELNNDNLLVMNNLAVCEVYLGNLVKAIEILETLSINNPTSAGTCETVIINMSTLYELRFEDATEKKIEVVKQVARYAGDSFQPDCIKLQ